MKANQPLCLPVLLIEAISQVSAHYVASDTFKPLFCKAGNIFKASFEFRISIACVGKFITTFVM